MISFVIQPVSEKFSATSSKVWYVINSNKINKQNNDSRSKPRLFVKGQNEDGG